MTEFINLLLQNTLLGTFLFLLILLFRKVSGNLTRVYVRILWFAMMLVLIMPPIPTDSLYTARSMLLDVENVFIRSRSEAVRVPVVYEPIAYESADIEKAGAQAEALPDIGTYEPNIEAFLYKGQAIGVHAKNSIKVLYEILFALYVIGAVVLTVKTLLEWIRLKRITAAAVRIQPDVWCIESISTPFVLPGVPSRIYIPYKMAEANEQLADILEHERRHIRNMDPWIKCTAVIILILHWFNPCVHIAFRLMDHDMEMYCDECVLHGKTTDQKRHYARTLLDFACKSRGISPALYFGESSTKHRILHILNTKYPHTAVSLLLFILIGVCCIFFLAAGVNDSQKEGEDANAKGILTDISSGEVDTAPANNMENNGENAEGNAAEPEAEGENWTEQRVVGTGYVKEEAGFTWSETDLMGETDHFALYGKKDEEKMAVRTPECLVYAEVPVISNYEVEPMLLEHDFDSDGEAELAIITYVLHGTGISVRSLFMTDHASDGSWKIYQYREQDYMTELEPHYGTLYTEEGVRFVLDGVPVGIAEETEQEELDNGYYYYAGSLVSFGFVEDKIYLRSEMLGYSQINFAGEYPGHELDAQVQYLGEGNWRLTDIRYADAGITEVIGSAIPSYIAGQEISEYDMVPGLKLPVFSGPGEGVILDISYPTEKLNSNEIEAYVTMRLYGEDSLSYLHVPMKRITVDSIILEWRISGEIIMEK